MHTILLIDQHISFNLLLIEQLRKTLGIVTCVQDVESAVREITSGKKYDLIISEILLPYGGASGEKLLGHTKRFDGISCIDIPAYVAGLTIWDKYTKHHLPQTPTLFFTTYIIGEDKVEELGIHYLPKPSEIESILEKAKELLNLKTV